MNDTTELDPAACPECGSTDWELRFGGRNPARIRCRGCKSDFTLGGQLVAAAVVPPAAGDPR